MFFPGQWGVSQPCSEDGRCAVGGIKPEKYNYISGAAHLTIKWTRVISNIVVNYIWLQGCDSFRVEVKWLKIAQMCAEVSVFFVLRLKDKFTSMWHLINFQFHIFLLHSMKNIESIYCIWTVLSHLTTTCDKTIKKTFLVHKKQVIRNHTRPIEDQIFFSHQVCRSVMYYFLQPLNGSKKRKLFLGLSRPHQKEEGRQRNRCMMSSRSSADCCGCWHTGCTGGTKCHWG